MEYQSIIPRSLTTFQTRVNDSFLRVGFLEFMKIVSKSLLRFRAFSSSTFLDLLISIAPLYHKPMKKSFTYLYFTLTKSYKIYGHLTLSNEGKISQSLCKKKSLNESQKSIEDIHAFYLIRKWFIRKYH